MKVQKNAEPSAGWHKDRQQKLIPVIVLYI